MNDRPSLRLRPAPSVHTRLFDGELVILDLAGGEYLALDAIGSLLWTGLEAGRAVEDIAHDIAAEYDVSFEQASKDLQELTDDLLRKGLFVRAPGGP